jgi:DNA-directed RNA polymerase specialized sigma24 family protein
MASDAVFVTDEELEGMLRQDPEFAIKMIDSDYGEAIARYIRSFCRHFDEDDVYEAYKATLKDFIRCTKKPDFDPQSPLKLVFHIAKLRAMARRRDKSLHRRPTMNELLDPLADDQKNTTTRLNFQLIKADWSEFRAILDKLVDELPEKQRHAMNAFVEAYWEIRTKGSKQRLAQQITDQYGYDCTASEAADNVRAAIETLALKLERAGFNLLKRD